MSAKPPVADWATDFDHTDPRWTNDPFPIWDDLRKRCPIAHTERFHDSTFRRASKTCARFPTTPSISRRGAWWCARCGSTRQSPARRSFRSARAPARPDAAASSVQSQGRREAEAGHAGAVREADRPLHRQRYVRRGDGLRDPHPDARHRAHARRARGRRRPVPPVDQDDARGGHPRHQQDRSSLSRR